jgi:hypothetical protein
MPTRLSDLPLEGMPVEVSRGLSYSDPAIVNYADKVNDAAGLPKGLLRSTILNGERSNPLQQSGKNALGVGQFLDATAQRYGLKDRTDPRASIDAMAKYYKDIIQKTKTLDPKILAAAYNSGENRPELKAGKVPNIPETQAYAKRVSASVEKPGPTIRLDQLQKQAIRLDELAAKDPAPIVKNMAPPNSKISTSAVKAAGKAALENTLPTVAGLASFGVGFEAGAWAGAPLVPFTGPVGPMVTGIIGGFTTSIGGAAAMGAVQNWAAGLVPQSVVRYFGMDQATRKAEGQQHPIASFIGGELPALATMRPGNIIKNVRTAVAMAGVGGTIEAGNELRTDGKLDPWKIAIASTVTGFANKPTKLGQSLLDTTTPHWTPLGKLAAQKAEYVEEIVKKGGENLRKSAEELWDNAEKAMQAATGQKPYGAKTAKEQREITGQHVKIMSDAIDALKKQRTVDELKIADLIASMPKDEFIAAGGENVYHAQPDEKNYQPPAPPGAPPRLGQAKPPLTPDEAYADKKWVKPLAASVDAAYQKVLARSDPHAASMFAPGGHNVRLQQRNWLTRLASIADNVAGGKMQNRFASLPVNARNRSMYAIQFDDGTRQIVHLDGWELGLYPPKGRVFKPQTILNLPRSRMVNGKAVAQSAPRVGDRIPVQGRNATITQATTAEIEAATHYTYSKNAFANNLFALTQMNAYLREADFLDRTVPEMVRQGHFIPKSDAMVAPRGYTSIENGPANFRKYWINERIAEVFNDELFHDPMQGLTKFNGFVAGMMFWSPAGHLMNTFDHALTTGLRTAFHPKEWGTFGNNMVHAYKVVRDLGPEYQSYLASGMGLNYGRVATESILEGVLKGTPKEGWARMAQSWGMRPDQLVKGLYDTSRHMLWAGSDMFMLTSHMHMASIKGKSIFDQAIRNYVEAHNPNYRIPPRVGFDQMMSIPGMPEAVAKAISRSLSWIMQTRAFDMFGRYHYGQFKSIGADLHDLTFQNKRSVETRPEALAHMAAVAFNLMVIYPMMWDTVAKVVSGNPDAQARRAGATTIPYTAYHIVLGDKDVNDLLKNAWNLPPSVTLIAETVNNRNMFTGQHIWEPGDSPQGKAFDYAVHASGEIAEPLRLVQQPGKELERSFGIQEPPDAKKHARYLKSEASAAKRRQKKRGF